MKKTGLFLLLLLAVAALRSKPTPRPSRPHDPARHGVQPRPASRSSGCKPPQTLICIVLVSSANSSARMRISWPGGLHTPNTTKFVNGDMIYLAGTGYTTVANTPSFEN